MQKVLEEEEEEEEDRWRVQGLPLPHVAASSVGSSQRLSSSLESAQQCIFLSAHSTAGSICTSIADTVTERDSVTHQTAFSDFNEWD